MAVEDTVAAEDIKIVVAAAVAATATAATTTTTSMRTKEASTTIKGLHRVSTIKGTTTKASKAVVVTKTIIKDPLKAKAAEESISTQEWEMISAILKWMLGLLGAPIK